MMSIGIGRPSRAPAPTIESPSRDQSVRAVRPARLMAVLVGGAVACGALAVTAASDAGVARAATQASTKRADSDPNGMTQATDLSARRAGFGGMRGGGMRSGGMRSGRMLSGGMRGGRSYGYASARFKSVGYATLRPKSRGHAGLRSKSWGHSTLRPKSRGYAGRRYGGPRYRGSAEPASGMRMPEVINRSLEKGASDRWAPPVRPQYGGGYGGPKEENYHAHWHRRDGRRRAALAPLHGQDRALARRAAQRASARAARSSVPSAKAVRRGMHHGFPVKKPVDY
jgi:hypothetical protein